MQLVESMTEDILKKSKTQYLGHYIDPMKVLSEDLLGARRNIYSKLEKSTKDGMDTGNDLISDIGLNQRFSMSACTANVTTGEAYHELVDAVHKACTVGCKSDCIQRRRHSTTRNGTR
jgi:hypothetical protein